MRKSLVTSILLLGAFSLAGLAAVQPSVAKSTVKAKAKVTESSISPSDSNTITLNVYGAYGQFVFWTQLLPTFLETVYGCPSGSVISAEDAGNPSSTPFPTAPAYWVTYTTAACTAGNGAGNNYIIRFSSKPSYDAIYALNGTQYAGDPSGIKGLTGSPICGSTQRPFAVTPSSGNPVTATQCLTVDLAATDVPGSSFLQTSPATTAGQSGQLFSIVARSFPQGVPTGTNGTSWNVYNPMIVPESFFVHNDVVVTQCSGGVDDGQQCASATDCDSGTCLGITSGTSPVPLSNISRLMAVLIFSGQVSHWTDFGKGFQLAGTGSSVATQTGSTASFNSSNPGAIVTCIRAAGAGSHANLDESIIRANGWNGGASLMNTVYTGAFGSPSTEWMDSIPNEMYCVNYFYGAIGYADADRALGCPPLYAEQTTPPYNYPNVMPLKYNGVTANRINIRNGLYDSFYSVETTYENPTNSNYSASHTLVEDLMAFAALPGSINTTDRKNYWTSITEMKFIKINESDLAYPAKTTATTPETP